MEVILLYNVEKYTKEDCDMNGDMKQLLEKALEFSREHWVLLLGIGLVLAILLISIAVVHSVKKSERESVETEPAMDEGQAKEVIVAEGTASDEVEVELIEDAEGMNVDPLSELKLQEDRVSEEDKDIYLDHSEKTNAKKTIQAIYLLCSSWNDFSCSNRYCIGN